MLTCSTIEGMSITKEFDTIAAISTPLGEGAIGIVRLSGTKALDIAKSIFKGKDLTTVASHTLNYGHIIKPSTGEVIDEVMVSVMLAPKTFTREDVIEINTHGGIAVTNDILRSEEHTSELQSRQYLVCRLLLEKKKKITNTPQPFATTALAYFVGSSHRRLAVILHH